MEYCLLQPALEESSRRAMPMDVDRLEGRLVLVYLSVADV